jgi:hypothetical protein
MEVPIADQCDEEPDMDEGLEAGLDLNPDWDGADPGHQGTKSYVEPGAHRIPDRPALEFACDCCPCSTEKKASANY